MLIVYFVGKILKSMAKNPGLIASGVTAGLGGLFTLGSTIAGLAASKKENDKSENRLNEYEGNKEAWFNQKLNQDYMTRSDVQNVLRKDREMYEERMRKARAMNVVSGGTDESLALQQEAAMKTHGNTIADIASNAAAYNDSIEQQQQQFKDTMLNARQEISANRVNAITQAASQAAGFGSSAMTAGLNGVVNSIVKKKV